MAKLELKLPAMGESIAEATLINWMKNIGDKVEIDDILLEIATDKVDSDVPSEHEGILVAQLFNSGDTIKIGEVFAILETEATSLTDKKQSNFDNQEQAKNSEQPTPELQESVAILEQQISKATIKENSTILLNNPLSGNIKSQEIVTTSGEIAYYSPLIRSIAQQEGLTLKDLEGITGTGLKGRVTKNDLLEFLKNRKVTPFVETNRLTAAPTPQPLPTLQSPVQTAEKATNPSLQEVFEPMSRMGKLISEHMTRSLQTSAHVQSFIEVDVSNLWNWRKKVKDAFMTREHEKITFTPVFIQAVAAALKKFPLMNSTLEGDTIKKKKAINIGMATALPDGHLIVPVIKNTDQLNLVGITKEVNRLANKARENALKPTDIQEGTYTVSNIGSFGTLFGTPIINQPQVGILAIGAIQKVPAVIETPEGDFIGIRYKLILSHSYDHRIINGALGGMFVKFIKDYLESWDINEPF